MNQKKQSMDQRDKFKNTKKLNEVVYEAKKKILQGAISEAYDELHKFITEQKDKLGGDDSVFLLPGLFVIAEIHIIENRIKKAEEYFNGAHWSFLKYIDKTQNDKKSKDKMVTFTKQEQIDCKINLHRTFARLYEAKNDFKQAINELKQSTYLECTKWGPQHPQVCLNYFLMGKIFIQMDQKNIGQSFYAKVAQIWYRYLKNFFQKGAEEQQSFLVQQLTLEQALNYLIYIERYFDQSYEDDQVSIVFTPVMRTYYSIGLLYKIFGDDEQCQGYLKQVYRRCLKYLPEDDKKTQNIKSILLGMNVDIEKVIEEGPFNPHLEEEEEDYQNNNSTNREQYLANQNANDQ